MLDLTKSVMCDSITVDGVQYPIHTDFKRVMRLQELFSAPSNLPIVEWLAQFDFMYTQKIPSNRMRGLEQLVIFSRREDELPRATGGGSEKVLDYAMDADLIYSAFMQQYGLDLIDSNIHWYKFLALLKGLRDTALNEVIDARLFKAGGKTDSYTRERLKQKAAWALPQKAASSNKDLEELEAQL